MFDLVCLLIQIFFFTKILKSWVYFPAFIFPSSNEAIKPRSLKTTPYKCVFILTKLLVQFPSVTFVTSVSLRVLPLCLCGFSVDIPTPSLKQDTSVTVNCLQEWMWACVLFLSKGVIYWRFRHGKMSISIITHSH